MVYYFKTVNMSVQSKDAKLENTNSYTVDQNLQNLVLELRDKIKGQEEKVENLESKLQESQFQLSQKTNDFKFKNKELKLQISDL